MWSITKRATWARCSLACVILTNCDIRKRKISAGAPSRVDRCVLRENEAVRDAGLDWPNVARDRVGVYIGITEHGNVETENEIYEISKFQYDTKVWSHHHNPRTVANNAAGEVTLNMGITGPHLTLGAACAAGNAGFIQAAQMLRLDEVDIAVAGGVSESIHTFGIFASFAAQGALATHEDPTKACRPFDINRNGIVVAEGGGSARLNVFRTHWHARKDLCGNYWLCDEFGCTGFCPPRCQSPS